MILGAWTMTSNTILILFWAGVALFALLIATSMIVKKIKKAKHPELYQKKKKNNPNSEDANE